MAKILLRFNENTGNAVYINPDSIDFIRCVKDEDCEYCRICVNGEIIEVEENFNVVKMILEKQDLVDVAHVLYWLLDERIKEKDAQIKNGLQYIIGESVDNIVEHSHSKYGYIVAQSYKSKGFTDICIADTGGTILGSYAGNPRTSAIESDIEAVQAAVSGVSAKNLPEAENRGFGLRTTIRMLTAGLSGEYLLASGDALYAAGANAAKFVELPFGVRFCGTVIAFRIPEIADDFDYMKYMSRL